jgi:invasion protein IalB
MTSIRAHIAGLLAFGLLSIGAASADPAPAAPLTPSETKTYGDWTVRCYPISSPSPCDMYELLANKQTNQRVMSLSIAYMPAGDKHVIQIAVPLGILIPKGLVI